MCRAEYEVSVAVRTVSISALPVHASQPVIAEPCKDGGVPANVSSGANACNLDLGKVILLFDGITPDAKAASSSKYLGLLLLHGEWNKLGL